MITANQREQIRTQRASRNDTRRVVSPALEEILYEPVPVLDHGFMRVVDYMGNDDAIVQAARVSYGTGTKSVRGDAGLISYLMRHRHTDTLRDVRDQVPREASGVRGPAVDSPPHRQRQRVFGALFDPGPGILCSGAREFGCTVIDQRSGQGQAA